jgi:hypothetical protein
MKLLFPFLLTIVFLHPVHAQQSLVEIFSDSVKSDWISEPAKFSNTEPSFFNTINADEYFIGQLEIGGQSNPFAWDSDLSLLRFISSKLDRHTVYSGAEADPNYLGNQIEWDRDLSVLLWFDDEPYESKIDHWYLIGRSDCAGIRKFPNVRFEQVFDIENPRFNRDTGLVVIPYDENLSAITKSNLTLTTTDGMDISGTGFDVNSDGLFDIFIHEETVNPTHDLPDTYIRLFVNIDGEWVQKWQHLKEDCL